MRTTRAITVALASGALLLAAGCDDEDGDGGVTDEEIQDVEDGAEDVGDEIEQEVDAQDEGTNEG
jgi:hypothetical protein